MNSIFDLKKGQVLTNSDIAKIFGCSTQGGMRRSKKTNTLVIISDQTKLYKDKWVNGVLHYTGMGQFGDQDFNYMQNKTMSNSKSNGVQMHLFEVSKPKMYTYLGIVELAGEPYVEQQLDKEEKLRNVCMFPLKILGDTQ